MNYQLAAYLDGRDAAFYGGIKCSRSTQKELLLG